MVIVICNEILMIVGFEYGSILQPGICQMPQHLKLWTLTGLMSYLLFYYSWHARPLLLYYLHPKANLC